MSSEQYMQMIQEKIGRRQLIFYGTRGCDAETLLGIDQLSHVISQVAPLQSAAVSEVCLETMTQERVDLNAYKIDKDKRDVIVEIRNQILAAFRSPAIVIPYRSTELLASAWFPRAHQVLHAGIFHEMQTCFEHKPWVETSLAERNIRIIPW